MLIKAFAVNFCFLTHCTHCNCTFLMGFDYLFECEKASEIVDVLFLLRATGRDFRGVYPPCPSVCVQVYGFAEQM